MKSISLNTIRASILLFFLATSLFSNAKTKGLSGIKHIDYFFENASPLSWEIQDDTIIRISLLADYERERFNRQTDHWYFRIEANKGTRIRLILSKALADVYNGNLAATWWNSKSATSCYISYDQQKWETVRATSLPNNELMVDFITKGESIYIARLPAYTENNLKILKSRINCHPMVQIIPVGHTAEKRTLEIIRVGNPDAKHNIILRARAHPWEPGGNWVIEGLIDKFLEDCTQTEKWKEQFCYYILPMANKDGVFHGMTRFNVAGRDLNRNWLDDIDTINAPENYALLKFTDSLISKGHKLSLAVDFHNDNCGDIHLTTPKNVDERYLKNMKLFRQLLTTKTWFSQNLRMLEQITGGGNMADGMYYKFGIDAFVFELNANYITKLDKIPEITDYLELGAKLNDTFYQYLLEKE